MIVIVLSDIRFLIRVNSFACDRLLSDGWYPGSSASRSMHNKKGESYAMDNCCYPDSFVAAGADYQLHNGRVYSHPAGHCRHRVSGPNYSGTKNIVAIWILPEEANYR